MQTYLKNQTAIAASNSYWPGTQGEESAMGSAAHRPIWPRAALMTAAVLTAVGLGFLRYWTGPELALSLFYLFPILAVTWFVGRWSGLVICFVSFASWLVADLQFKQQFSQWYIPYLNETFRLVVFVVISIVMAELRAALDRQKLLALIDPLTNLSNRRAFIERATGEILRAKRSRRPLSMVYIDLDNFKYINDTYGHARGDEVLCAVAQCLVRNCRETDLVARLGGDEFLVLFSETDHAKAKFVTGRLQAGVRDLMEHHHWPLTFSGGCITYQTSPPNVDHILAQTDKLLYTAKRNGKNRVEFEQVIPPSAV